MQHLRDAAHRLVDHPILVIGDLILDRYIEGSARRVSPEAPVLVFEAGDERQQLGGAGNVAANLAALGARAAVLGTVGEDVGGEVLRQLLAERGIGTGELVADPVRPTTRKTRYVSKTSQIMRVDREHRRPVSGDVEQAVLARLGRRPFPYTAVVLSDYDKGMLTRPVIEAAIAAAHSVGGQVVVDPKGPDYSKYRGVDLLTPNLVEAETATGLRVGRQEDLHGVAARLREITGVRTVTVTLGQEGIFYEAPDGAWEIFPTEARAVFDVTGAGDTVVAVLALATASGLEIPTALRLANVAAGIVVGRFGTWAVSREDLLAMLDHAPESKVVTPEAAAQIAARLRRDGRRLVFTNGCFDILHSGHTDYLRDARRYGDALMVAVNTDESVRRQGKGDGRPINSLADRMDVLAALQSVDHVVPFDDETPEALIRAVTPHVLVKGEDWRDRGVVGADWVESHGGQVVLVKLRPGRSTSSIVERIRKGDAD